MAANPNYTRYSTDRMVITGILNNDGTAITYVDNAGTTYTNATLASLLVSFYSKDVEIAISTTVNSSNEGSSYIDSNAEEESESSGT